MLHVAILKEGQIKIFTSPVDRSSPGPESVQLGVEAALEALRGGGDLRHLGVEGVHLQHHSRVRQHAAFNADS